MKKSLPALTSLRFFAAAMIVIQHSAGYFHVGETLTANYNLAQGVTFFFVLSGFILTYAHKDLSGIANSMKFIWARIARVWPAHLFTMLVFWALWIYAFNTGLQTTPIQFWTNFTLTQAWALLPSIYFAYNGVAWTLSVEMFFYALFPLLILNLSKTWHLKLVLAALLAAASIYISISTGTPVTSTADEVSSASWVYIWPPARLFEFVIGMAAGQAFLSFGHRLGAARGQSSIGIAAIAILLLGAVGMPELSFKLESLGLIDATTRGWVRGSGAAPFFALALFLLASTGGLVTNALSWRPLVLLGEISFSIYLVHQIIIRSMMIKHQIFAEAPVWILLPMYWTATILISYILWRAVEQPCQRLMNSFIKPKQSKHQLLSKQKSDTYS